MNEKTLTILIKANDQASRKLDGIGGKISRFASKAFLAAKVATVAIGALLGKYILGGGISRALNIEDAQAKLKGLGHSTKSIENIMDSALKSVKGTAFGLDAAATAAASAVAAGVKPGKALTRVLSITGDTATIMGREFGEAGAIINKVLASNRLSMEEVNQLQDAGLPILSMLQKEYGKSASELRDMVSSGEIDSKRFLNALEKNVGGAALASGETTRGAWENMKAAMSRVGAAIVEDIIPKVRNAFVGMTNWFDSNSDRIVQGVSNAATKFQEFGNKAIELGTQVAASLKPKLIALWNTISTQLIPALNKLWKNVIQPMLPVLGVLFVAAVGLAIDVLNIAIGVIAKVTQILSENKDVVYAVIGAIALYKAALLIASFASAFNSAVMGMVGVLKVYRTQGLAAAITQTKIFRRLVKTPMSMPAIAVAAALASIYLVLKAIQSVIGAIDAMNNAASAATAARDARNSANTKLSKMEKSKDIDKRLRASAAKRRLGLDGFAEGGFTGRGGYREVAGVVHKGEYVVPKSQVDQSSGMPKFSGGITLNMNGNWVIDSDKRVEQLAKRIMSMIDSDKELAELGAGV